jgi:hypothetical protein
MSPSPVFCPYLDCDRTGLTDTEGCVRTQNTRHLSPIIRLKTKANSPLNSKKNLHFKPRQHRFARLSSKF